jgi:hypothetical protein
MASGIKESGTKQLNKSEKPDQGKTKLIKGMAHGVVSTDNVLSPNCHHAQGMIGNFMNHTDLVDQLFK